MSTTILKRPNYFICPSNFHPPNRKWIILKAFFMLNQHRIARLPLVEYNDDSDNSVFMAFMEVKWSTMAQNRRMKLLARYLYRKVLLFLWEQKWRYWVTCLRETSFLKKILWNLSLNYWNILHICYTVTGSLFLLSVRTYYLLRENL